MWVIVEVLVPAGVDPSAPALARLLEDAPVRLDPEFTPASSGDAPDGTRLYVVRGDIEERRWEELERHPRVHAVWKDTPIEPFGRPGL